MIEEIDDNRDKIQYLYDSARHKVAEIDKDGRTTYWVYDKAGNVKAQIDKAGNTRVYDYDRAASVTRKVVNSKTVKAVVNIGKAYLPPKKQQNQKGA